MKKVREGYKMTELGEIPEDWEVKRLSQVTDINPESLNKKVNKNAIINYIDIDSVTTGRINNIKQYTFIESPSRARRIIHKDDIIISTVRPYLKAFTIVNKDMDYLVCSTGFAVLRVKKGNNSHYLYQFTLSESFLTQLSNRMVGSNYPAVNSSDIRNTLIPIPSYKEQQKIADILSTVDEHIEETEGLIEKTKELKKGLMQRLLTKGIGHTKFKKTEVGEIPVEWKVKRAGEVFYTVTDYVANGSFASLKENVNYRDEEDYAILIRLTDYNNNFQGPFIYIDKKGYNFLNKSCLEPGDIIIASVGAYAGFPFRIPNINKPMTLGPNAILVRSNENKDYIFYWLQSRFGQESLKDIISITAQPKFNKTDFKTLLIPIPSYKEQQKLALILLLIDEKISQYESQKENLKRLKNGLMQKLLTGKIRVKV